MRFHGKIDKVNIFIHDVVVRRFLNNFNYWYKKRQRKI